MSPLYVLQIHAHTPLKHRGTVGTQWYSPKAHINTMSYSFKYCLIIYY